MSKYARPKRAGARYWVLKKGVLYARLQYSDEFGRKREKYRKITAKGDAKSAVEDMRQEVQLHGSETLHSDRVTFVELADKYESVRITPAVFCNGVKVSGKKSVSPIKSILKTLRAHFGKKPIRLIKASDIESFKNTRIATPIIKWVNEERLVYNPKTKRKKKTKFKVALTSQRNISTINREMQTLKAIFNFAIQNDWLILNPFQKCKGIISVGSETKRERVLSYDEEERLLLACKGRRAHLRPIIICALDTGMRRGELFQMKWRDVDFEGNRIFIPQSNTKTQTARSVGITDRLRQELLKIRSSMPPDYIVFGITSDVKNAWKAALAEAGIENFRLHDCRHTATTRMIASGSPHTEVMKITGHSQMSTFLRYLNVTAETTKRVAGRLDNYLADREPIYESVNEFLN